MKPVSCWILLLCLLAGDIQTNPGPALRVFQQNVNSIKGKLGVMRSHAGELADYHAICLTESKLGPSVGDSELQLGFSDSLFSKHRQWRLLSSDEGVWSTLGMGPPTLYLSYSMPPVRL